MNRSNDTAVLDTLATLLRERGWTVIPPGNTLVPEAAPVRNDALLEPADSVTWTRRTREMLTLYYTQKHGEREFTAGGDQTGGVFDLGTVTFAEIASDMVRNPIDFRRQRNVGVGSIREVFRELARRGFVIPEQTRRRSGVGLK